MDYAHARRFATREARRIAGDLYPGPVLMPRGLLRSLDAVLAFALGPARRERESLEQALEDALRGRPDGPLLLALWNAVTAGELRHDELRFVLRHYPVDPPDEPRTRGELLAWLHPRASVVARCGLALAQRDDPEALPPAERLACGFAVTRFVTDLPAHLARGRLHLPLSDLEACGLGRAELEAGVRTPAVDAFLQRECAWARELLREGLPVCEAVGARLRRGLRAAALRAGRLLDQVEDAQRDPFRRSPQLGARARWRCALRALRPLGAKT